MDRLRSAEAAMEGDAGVGIMGEEVIWKYIEGYGERYQISSDGQVRSFTAASKGAVMAPRITKQGYNSAALTLNNKQKIHPMHRLVAKAFICNPDNKRCVNHIDGVKANNNVSNLEWCTNKENSIHAFRHGLIKFSDEARRLANIKNRERTGEKSTQSKKVIDTVTKKIFNSIKEAAEYVGIKHKTLSAQLLGQNKNQTSLTFY